MKSVLVVDDSATMRRMVMSSLRGIEQFTFLEAANGLEAIEKLAISPIALVILDLNMPDMHGLEVVAFMRKHATFRDLPIIVLTTRGDDDSRVCGPGRRGHVVPDQALRSSGFGCSRPPAALWRCPLTLTLATSTLAATIRAAWATRFFPNSWRTISSNATSTSPRLGGASGAGAAVGAGSDRSRPIGRALPQLSLTEGLVGDGRLSRGRAARAPIGGVSQLRPQKRGPA